MPHVLIAQKDGEPPLRHELQSQHAALVIARALIEQGLEVRIDGPDGNTIDAETVRRLIEAL